MRHYSVYMIRHRSHESRFASFMSVPKMRMAIKTLGLFCSLSEDETEMIELLWEIIHGVADSKPLFVQMAAGHAFSKDKLLVKKEGKYFLAKLLNRFCLSRLNAIGRRPMFVGI